MAKLDLAALRDHAERMFTACAELRLQDAAQRGRDSDVFYGRCHTLAELGLIERARVLRLDREVGDRLNTFHGNRHA